MEEERTQDLSEVVDETIDTTDGTRDPLTTDEGLGEAAYRIAESGLSEAHAPVTGEDSAAHRQLQDVPGLDVEPNGTDPLAHLAEPGTEA
jgi:hypothetical protein